MLILKCACGWTRAGYNETMAWLRIFVHELRNHRKDPTFWAANSVTRITVEEEM